MIVPRTSAQHGRFDNEGMLWHLYCRVVDNFGDVGVAWRLAADLAGRGESVRLFVDDASALTWMAPSGATGVEVRPWTEVAGDADVVVELFGAGLPVGVDAGVHINLEHLSAEAYVERSHGLPSPRRSADGDPATTWFFYPGFADRTGGLIREPGVLDGRSRRAASNERRVSLFSYRNDAIDGLLGALAGAPTLLLVSPGPAATQVAALLGPALARGRLRAELLPYLAQPNFDALLRSCDLAFVRGEDSPVRAIWAGVPFVWQLYPQDDGAHAAKLAAFLDGFLDGAAPTIDSAIGSTFRCWNGDAAAAAPWRALEPGLLAEWRLHCAVWRTRLARQPDLTTQLIAFATSKR